MGTRKKRWLGALGMDTTSVLGADIKSLSAGPAGIKTVSEPDLPPRQEEPRKSRDGGVEVGGDRSPSSWRSSRVDGGGAKGLGKVRKDREGWGAC